MDWRTWIAAGLVIGVGLGSASGQDPDRKHKHSHGRPKSTVATPHTWEQAGYPQCVSAIAHPSDTGHYSGGYAGGGKSHGGHARCANEGTFGWDYTPFRPLSSHIFMNWSHGRHFQGSTEGYATDGPRPIEHITEAVREHRWHE